MKRVGKLYLLVPLFLGSCGGGEPSVTPLPTAISVNDMHANIQSEYSRINATSACGTPYRCLDTVAFDCQSNVDGPRNYYDDINGALVMSCGGACLAPDPANQTSCKACPPPVWTCSNFQ